MSHKKMSTREDVQHFPLCAEKARTLWAVG
jgi:hypothetical protein